MKRLIVSLFCILPLIGCQQDNSVSGIITDENTKPEIEQFSDASSHTVVEYTSGGMSRGNHEYERNVVMDEDYYNENSLERGDVIYFETPEIDKEKYPNLHPNVMDISRVVALPGETIEIKDGNVIIDNKQLNTFYGSSLSLGMTQEEYLSYLDEQNATYDEKRVSEYFSRNMKEIELSDNEIFVLGDNGYRSIDSSIFGPLSIDAITGKVIGTKKNLNFDDNVAEIEIVDWETEEHVGKVDDKQFINELLDDLNIAGTLSTNGLKFDKPPYKLLFKNNGGEILHKLGYYKSSVLMGISGQYWEFNQIYGLSKEIPPEFFD
ncbi:signal peptidase I [Bacillus sp. SCS-153A]|uniref:signal peptidase I n=1 Tax=Rossellomorea sedimentorum TaxID=3115294 RepID=UPI003906964B